MSKLTPLRFAFFTIVLSTAMAMMTLSATNAMGNEAPNSANGSFNLNLRVKTLGGTQFWTDYIHRRHWRIQRHAWTGHHRLLDVNDVRTAWGSIEHCQRVLDEQQPAQTDASKTPSRAYVLLHGLMRTHHCMNHLDQVITDRDPDATVVCFAYASTRHSIADSALALRSVLENLDGTPEIRFVGHSMGNIVVRHMLGDLTRSQSPKSDQLLSRCRAMVMLGPPNNGAAIARRLSKVPLYGWVAGPGGLELGPHFDHFADHLVQPDFPFLIVAGDVSSQTIQNPLVDGPSDFVVSLEEASLSDAEKISTVSVLHSFLMKDEAAVDQTVEFLMTHDRIAVGNGDAMELTDVDARVSHQILQVLPRQFFRVGVSQ